MRSIQSFVLALLLLATACSYAKAKVDPSLPMHEALTSRQKILELRPAVLQANKCIADYLADTAKIRAMQSGREIGERIVESMRPCLPSITHLIDEHDRLYGDGTGETFFMGIYLDMLTQELTHMLSKSTGALRGF